MSEFEKNLNSAVVELSKVLTGEMDRRVPAYEQEGIRGNIESIRDRIDAVIVRIKSYPAPREVKAK